MEPTHDHTRRIGSAAIGASVKTIATAATIAPGVLSCTAISEARDNGRNKLVSDDMEAWSEGLTDRAGACWRSDADGVLPREGEWGMGGG
jgi:hypothetical protein